MLRNRFSVALLALLLATAMPGSVSAADTSNDATSQVIAPVFQSVSVEGAGNTQNPDMTDPDAFPPEQEPLEDAPPTGSDEPADVQAPGEVAEPAMETQEPSTEVEPPAEPQADEDGTPIETPSFESDGTLPPEESIVTEPAIIVDSEVISPEEDPIVTEPAIVVDEPVTEPAIVVDTEIIAPVEPIVTEPAIIVEEVVTEPAIIVEPVAATLTITHRLTVGDEYVDEIQTIEGLETAQTIDLKQYAVTGAWIECISSLDPITLDGEQNSVTIEYKPAEGVVIRLSEDIN
jgi:hypothetical protein